MNTKAHDRMQAAEIMYLLENGWRRLPNTTPDGSVLWTGMSDKYSHGITQGHAVHVQMQHDRVSLKHQPTRRLVVEVSDNGAVHYEEMARVDAHKFLDEYPLGCEYKEHLLRADLEAKAQRNCADDLAKELLERNKQLSAAATREVELTSKLTDANNKYRARDAQVGRNESIISHLRENVTTLETQRYGVEKALDPSGSRGARGLVEHALWVMGKMNSLEDKLKNANAQEVRLNVEVQHLKKALLVYQSWSPASK